MLKANTDIRTRAAGFSLLEVMITILIVSVGLLGLAGLHARSLVAEAEAGGRGQALALIQDLAQRIEANQVGAKTAISNTLTISNIGCGYSCSTGSQFNTDLCEWQAAVTSAKSLPDACGCIETISANNELLLSLAWRGHDNGFAPTAAQTCGSGAITTNRRVVSTRVRIPSLGG